MEIAIALIDGHGKRSSSSISHYRDRWRAINISPFLASEIDLDHKKPFSSDDADHDDKIYSIAISGNYDEIQS